jgi:hypothetical protein
MTSEYAIGRPEFRRYTDGHGFLPYAEVTRRARDLLLHEPSEGLLYDADSQHALQRISEPSGALITDQERRQRPPRVS